MLTKAATKTQIQITNWKPFERKTLKGLFTAVMPSGIVLHSLMLHQKDQQRWIGLPARETKDNNGDTYYAPYISFVDKETREQFQQCMLSALDEQKPWEHEHREQSK